MFSQIFFPDVFPRIFVIAFFREACFSAKFSPHVPGMCFP